MVIYSPFLFFSFFFKKMKDNGFTNECIQQNRKQITAEAVEFWGALAIRPGYGRHLAIRASKFQSCIKQKEGSNDGKFDYISLHYVNI